MPKILCAFFLLLCSCSIYAQVRHQKQEPNNSIVWSTKSIPVCWENPSANNTIEREWVKQAITRTWQKESMVQFTDWCPCHSRTSQSGIRILISDDKQGARVVALGSGLNNVPNGMVLNFNFTKWGTGLIPYKVPNRQAAIQITAVHEFGHALGFSHQQIRDECYLCNVDNSTLNTEITNEVAQTSTEDGLWFTPCDPYSVMNYCNEDYLNLGVLSAYDKDAVGILYGRPARTDTIQNTRLEYTAQPLSSTINPNNTPTGPSAHSQVVQDDRSNYKVTVYHWYLVNLYINAKKSDLDNIKNVEYLLDPSLDNDHYAITNRQTNFKTSFTAWGSFLVKATVHFKNGSNLILQTNLDQIQPISIEVTEKRKGGGIHLRNPFKKIPRKSGK